MRFDNCLTNCQTQADSLSRQLCTVFHLMKLVKNLFFMPVGDAGAGIGNSDHDLIRLAATDSSQDFASGGRELESVLVQIPDDLNNPIAIASCKNRAFFRF